MHIIGERYHVYNRGAHKAAIFGDKNDYDRFVSLLYIANTSKKLMFARLYGDIFSVERPDTFVHIFAYCLMPNHFHLGLIEKEEKGIERFTKKLWTAYSMYYNKKYSHSGTIIQGSCKSKHIDSQEYFQYLIEYIHLNPFGIEEPNLLREAKQELKNEAIEYSKNYLYSSFRDYLGEKRPENKILSIMYEVSPCHL
ncbi:MAG: transposase [Patescibacteria group bacterium]|nr:transposase [Patescibacteria group bacterium]